MKAPSIQLATMCPSCNIPLRTRSSTLVRDGVATTTHRVWCHNHTTAYCEHRMGYTRSDDVASAVALFLLPPINRRPRGKSRFTQFDKLAKEWSRCPRCHLLVQPGESCVCVPDVLDCGRTGDPSAGYL